MRVPSKLEQNYDKLARKSIVLLVADCFDVDSTYVDDIYEWIVEYMKIISGMHCLFQLSYDQGLFTF